eukprot:gnl/Trimastix_PCT/326.p1 GENE.gnl/Trimastix_PCT/326~~gnl/Trimastix_PCT/326.p1  ORF type:complete len:887 (-),score=347.50 gnl/Trimastix_PCT/326:27-2687(-)
MRTKGQVMHMKRKERGSAKNYVTRKRALQKLQISLPVFRKLCIIKGIYPREPKRKFKGNNKTYYHVKDIKILARDALMDQAREYHAHQKKVKKALGRKDKTWAEQIKNERPRFKMDRVLKERYPCFGDALRDLNDALNMIHLFATLPSFKVAARRARNCRRLVREFQSFIASTKSLRKVFVSIKGIYYQASVFGYPITWLEPYHFSQRVPSEVDIKAMKTFAELYETLCRFVNYKLYSMAGLKYPPPLDETLDAQGCGLLCINNVFEDPDEEEDPDLPPEDPTKKLFDGLVFFLGRETPTYSLEFVLLSCGARVAWDGPGSPYKITDDRITHQVVDRPLKERLLTRTYVQPQWVYDCVNAGVRLPVGTYIPGAKLPPHVSPFEDPSSTYVPKQVEWLRRQQQAARGVLVNQEDPDELLDAAESDEESGDEEMPPAVAAALAEAGGAESGEEESEAEMDAESDDDDEGEEEEEEDALEAGVPDAPRVSVDSIGLALARSVARYLLSPPSTPVGNAVNTKGDHRPHLARVADFLANPSAETAPSTLETAALHSIPMRPVQRVGELLKTKEGCAVLGALLRPQVAHLPRERVPAGLPPMVSASDQMRLRRHILNCVAPIDGAPSEELLFSGHASRLVKLCIHTDARFASALHGRIDESYAHLAATPAAFVLTALYDTCPAAAAALHALVTDGTVESTQGPGPALLCRTASKASAQGEPKGEGEEEENPYDDEEEEDDADDDDDTCSDSSSDNGEESDLDPDDGYLDTTSEDDDDDDEEEEEEEEDEEDEEEEDEEDEEVVDIDDPHAWLGDLSDFPVVDKAAASKPARAQQAKRKAAKARTPSPSDEAQIKSQGSSTEWTRKDLERSLERLLRSDTETSPTAERRGERF